MIQDTVPLLWNVMKMLILYSRLPKEVDSEDIEASSFRQSLWNRGDFLIGLCSFTKVSQDSDPFLCLKHLISNATSTPWLQPVMFFS